MRYVFVVIAIGMLFFSPVAFLVAMAYLALFTLLAAVLDWAVHQRRRRAP